MKKATLFSVIFLFLFSVSGYAQTTIPNPGFESWTNTTTASSWTTSVPALVSYGKQTTDSHTGDYAMLIKGATVLGSISSPGVCQLGKFVVDIPNMSVELIGGTPFSALPTKMNVWVKYLPDGEDTLQIVVLATRWNDDSGRQDPIAGAMYRNPNTISEYSLLEIPIEQVSGTEGMLPDTLNIIFTTDISQNCSMNTELYIDDISIEIAPGSKITENSKVHFTVSPNPATENILIQMQDVTTSFSMQLFDIAGRKIVDQTGLSNNASIAVGKFPKGIYLLIIEQNGVETSRKVVVE